LLRVPVEQDGFPRLAVGLYYLSTVSAKKTGPGVKRFIKTKHLSQSLSALAVARCQFSRKW
jgi:hypothetical protein